AEFLRLIFPGREDRVFAYADLVAEAGRWARVYARKGLKSGDRVIVTLPHSLALYAAYIGALFGGQVPAMFAFPSAKLSEEVYFATAGRLIAGSRAKLLVAERTLGDALHTRAADAIKGVHLVTPEDADAERPGFVEPPVVKADDTAFLQYSSGTTGIKKGVVLSHRALLWQVAAYGDAIGAGPTDRVVTWLPLYHDMGLIAAFFLPLLHKIPIVAMSPHDWVVRPALWLQAVTQHRGTLAWMPNFAFSFLARSVPEAELTGLDLSSLRGLVNCSEPVMAASHTAFLARFASRGFRSEALAASYAMAENTFAVTSAGFGQPPLVEHIDSSAFEQDGRCVVAAGGRAMVSSGRVLPETDLAIEDEAGRALGERRVGEIVVASPCLMAAYDGDAEATASALQAGRFRTGDLGYIAGGELFVTGRKKDLIIVGGRNLYPQDIEEVVSRVAGIIPGRCVAFGVPDEAAGTERLVVLAESEAPAVRHAAIKSAIYAAVAGQTEAVPGDICILPPRSLLKSSSGKLARSANRDRYREELSVAVAPVVAPAATEGGPLAAVRRVVRGRLRLIPGLDLDAVTDTTPLLSSGLIDSFALAELVVALEAETDRALPPGLMQEIENIDTIAAIAGSLASGGMNAAANPAQFPAAIPMAHDAPQPLRRAGGWWTLYYRLLFRAKGIACDRGLKVFGRLILQIDGKPAHIRIGANVTLMPGVHLKNRENGRIVLHDGVKLDSMVRLVAANDATIEIGENVTLGMGSVINAGADVRIGRDTMASAYCMFNASDHRMARGTPIRRQPFEHAPILVGEDVFVGAHAYIGKGSRIGTGAAVSAGAAVTGEVPAGAVVQGRPARVIKYRS
ncbi:MAG: AMP-binding protein, partial [Stellaceae bacterium]